MGKITHAHIQNGRVFQELPMRIALHCITNNWARAIRPEMVLETPHVRSASLKFLGLCTAYLERMITMRGYEVFIVNET